MKKKYITAAFILALSVSSFSSERDDLKFVDELYKQKKFDMAIIESKDFLNKYPTSKYNKNLIDRIAKVYFLQENYEDAIKYFKMLLMFNDLDRNEKYEINYYLVRAYAALGDKATSTEYLNLIEKKSELYDKAILDTATAYLAQEHYDDAKEAYSHIDKESKYYNEVLLSLALLSYNQKQYDNAINYIEQYSEKANNKQKDFMYYLLGSAYYKKNNIDSAISAFDKAIATNKDSVYGQKAILNLIEIYSNKGDVKTTEEQLNLLKSPADRNEGLRIFGDSYATKGEYEKAISYYSQIQDLSNPKLLYSYGFSLFKLGKLKEAQSYFESLKNTSYYNQAMYYIFAIDYKLQNYKKILDNKNEIKRVIVNQQDTESINLIIANSAYKLGKYQLSRDYYGRMYATNPTADNLYRIIIIDKEIDDLEDMQIRFNEYKNKFGGKGEQQKNIYLAMGELYFKKGNLESSENVYKEYLATSQDFDILNNLVTVLLAQKKYDEMLQYLDQTDNSIDSLYLKGIAYVGIGKHKEAGEYFKKIEENPNVTPELLEKVQINKTRNFFLAGDYKNAIETAQIYIDKYPNGNNVGEALDKMAISYFRMDDFENSRKAYAQLKNIKGFEEYAQFQIADSYYAQKDYEKAMENYSLVAHDFPDGKYTESANYWYLNSLVNLKKIDQFEIEKSAFLKRYPNSPMKENIYILSGQIYENSGDSEKILKTYKSLYDNATSENIKEDAATKILDTLIAQNKLDEAMNNVESLKNDDTKSYYKSLIFERQNKTDEAMKEYDKLFQGTKYKEMSGMKLGEYYFNKKMYDKAKIYYTGVNNLEHSRYKDLVLFQLSNIDEIQGKNNDALRGYTKGYVMYNGEYSLLSKLKAAEVSEKLGKNKDAEKLYKELYKEKNFAHKSFVLEKLLYFSLKRENKVEAKKYYLELQNINKEASNKYKQFFN